MNRKGIVIGLVVLAVLLGAGFGAWRWSENRKADEEQRKRWAEDEKASKDRKRKELARDAEDYRLKEQEAKLAQQKKDEEKRRQDEDLKKEQDRKNAEAARVKQEQDRRDQEHMKKLYEIIAQTKKLSGPGESTVPPTGLPLPCRAVIWDALGLQLHHFQKALRPDIRGNGSDPELMIYYVTELGGQFIDNYKVKYRSSDPKVGDITDLYKEGRTVPAYRPMCEVRVVSWPGKRVMGTFTINGNDPPLKVELEREQTRVVGDMQEKLVEWVQRQYKRTTLERFLFAENVNDVTHIRKDSISPDQVTRSFLMSIETQSAERPLPVRWEIVKQLRWLYLNYGSSDEPKDAEQFSLDPARWEKLWIERWRKKLSG